MRLRSEDQEWLRAEIAGQISKIVDSFNPHGWKKLARWLREWGIVGTNVAIIVTLLGMTLTAAYYAFSRVGKEAAFEATTTRRLDEVEATLKLIPAQIADAKYSTIPPQELKVHRDELKAVKATLASANRNAPNFWPVSFQIIKLLSMATSYIQNPNATHSELDNVSGVHVVRGGDVILLKQNISNTTIENSVVQFDPNVRLMNVTFKNCVFILPEAEATPPQPIQQIGTALLTASDITNVSITTS